MPRSARRGQCSHGRMKEIEFEKHASGRGRIRRGGRRRQQRQQGRKEYCFTKRFLAYFRPEVAAIARSPGESKRCKRGRARGVCIGRQIRQTCAQEGREKGMMGGRHQIIGNVSPVFDTQSVALPRGGGWDQMECKDNARACVHTHLSGYEALMSPPN